MRLGRSWIAALAAALAVMYPTVPSQAASASPMAFGVTMTSISELPTAESLAGEHPFVVRVPIVWLDPPETVSQRALLARESAARGWRVVVNLRYRVSPDDLPTNLGAFRAWVASMVTSLSDIQGVSFEVGTRSDSPDPSASSPDPIAQQALVHGVLAASEASDGAQVGFSWLATGVAATDGAWWAGLRSLGGALSNRIGFVSVQLFPGSQGPSAPWALGGPRATVESILRDTRQRYMPVMGLDSSVAIEVGEFGAPVLAERVPYSTGNWDLEQAFGTPASQARSLTAIAEAIWSASAGWGIRGASWTLLSDPASGCLADRCWGLVSSSGAERPALDQLRFQISLASG